MENVLDIKIIWKEQVKLTLEQLIELLRIFGDQLPDPLSKRVDLRSYAEKLENNAEIALAFHNKRIVGFLAMYANDFYNGKAHIPIVSVLKDFQGKGIGKALLSRAIALARQRKMINLWLTVDKDNLIAQHFYSEFRFIKTSSDGSKFIMSRDLSLNKFLLQPQITPLESGKNLCAQLGLDIDLRIKRDDLYPISGGGIKARKIGFIVKKAIEDGYDAIVTNGGPQSNHARATSTIAAQLGLKCHIIIVAESETDKIVKGNLLLMKMSGATIEFCSKSKLDEYMNQAVNILSKKGYNPLYIWGGGHCLQGTIAFIEAAKEAQKQCGDWIPDYLILASGTGSTQAGLSIGYRRLPTQVIGISIARSKKRGSKIIYDLIAEYFLERNNKHYPFKVNFRDEWNDGGYEMQSEELIELISLAAKCGYFFDPTYSGKALRGLVSLVKSCEITKGSKVLLWHTGGLMNLISSETITSKYSI